MNAMFLFTTILYFSIPQLLFHYSSFFAILLIEIKLRLLAQLSDRPKANLQSDWLRK